MVCPLPGSWINHVPFTFAHICRQSHVFPGKGVGPGFSLSGSRGFGGPYPCLGWTGGFICMHFYVTLSIWGRTGGLICMHFYVTLNIRGIECVYFYSNLNIRGIECRYFCSNLNIRGIECRYFCSHLIIRGVESMCFTLLSASPRLGNGDLVAI